MAPAGGHWWSRTIVTIALEQMAHRPPLPKRWVVYCALAYLVPIIAMAGLPEDWGKVREISWLVTLAPAFILSLHYGMLGALAGLIAGTVLYIAVQLILGLSFVHVDQDVLLPIYVSYGMLAIAVGWLSQQLHDYYGRLVKGERLAAVGQVAVTLRHELNNALQAIAAEAAMLQAAPLGGQEKDSVDTIQHMARRIQADVQKLAQMQELHTTDYLAGTTMVDLRS